MLLLNPAAAAAASTLATAKKKKKITPKRSLKEFSFHFVSLFCLVFPFLTSSNKNDKKLRKKTTATTKNFV